MPDESAVTTRRLRKEYDNVIALRALDLEIPRGEIFGLIGPNGAGKTTLLKILSTTLQPDFGFASVAGHNVETAPLAVRRSIGYMPDFFALYESVTAGDFLTYFGLAFGADRNTLPNRVEELLAAVNLSEKRNNMISELSRGMRQRLVLAKTILHNPSILLLDEPLSGLDPKSRMEVRDILRAQHKKGKTIIISSHILAEMSGFCTSVGILEKGQLRISGSIDEIRGRLQGARQISIEIAANEAANPETFRATMDSAARIIAEFPGATVSRAEGNSIKFTLPGERARIAEINTALVKAGIAVIGIREEQGELEEIYFQIAAHEVQ